MSKSRTAVPKTESDWDKKYALDEDVRSLARAHAIKKDAPRHAAAKKHAGTMVEEHKKKMEESKAIIGLAKQK